MILAFVSAFLTVSSYGYGQQNESDDPNRAAYDAAMVKIEAGEVVEGYKELIAMAPLSGPGYSPAHIQIARYLYEQGPTMLPAARRHVQFALVADKRSQDAIEIQTEMEWAVVILGDWKTAIDNKEFAPVIRLYEDELQKIKPLLEEGTNKTAKSRNGYLRILLIHAYYGQAMLLGQAEEKDVNGKIELLRKVIELDPTNESALLALTELVIVGNAEHSEKARAIYNPTTDTDAPVAILSYLGNHHLSGGNPEKAIECFSTALEKSPQNPLMFNNLAYCYLQSIPPDGEKALELITQGIELLESFPQKTDNMVAIRSHFYDTKAKSFMIQKRFAEAAAAYQTALEGRPGDEKLKNGLDLCNKEVERRSGSGTPAGGSEPPSGGVTPTDEPGN